LSRRGGGVGTPAKNGIRNVVANPAMNDISGRAWRDASPTYAQKKAGIAEKKPKKILIT
jgi:alpha-glucuronidase